MFQISHTITILYPYGYTISDIRGYEARSKKCVCVCVCVLGSLSPPLSSTSPIFTDLYISDDSYYYPSLYISLQCMKIILVPVTRGSKGSELPHALPTLTPRQPLLVTKDFTSFTNFYVLYTSYYPSLTTKSQI